MYQVTAVYYGSEIGYGEGDSFDYALEECIESMDAVYDDFSECKEIIIRWHEEGKYRKQATLAQLFEKA
jgi:hypothetical protein